MSTLSKPVSAKFVSELADAICKVLKDAGIPFMRSGKFVNFLSKAFGYKDFNTLKAADTSAPSSDDNTRDLEWYQNKKRAYIRNTIRDIFSEASSLLVKFNNSSPSSLEYLKSKIEKEGCESFMHILQVCVDLDEGIRDINHDYPLDVFSEEDVQFAADMGVRFRGNVKDFHQFLVNACYNNELIEELGDFAENFEDSLPSDLNPVNLDNLPWSKDQADQFKRFMQNYIETKI